MAGEGAEAGYELRPGGEHGARDGHGEILGEHDAERSSGGGRLRPRGGGDSNGPRGLRGHSGR